MSSSLILQVSSIWSKRAYFSSAKFYSFSRYQLALAVSPPKAASPISSSLSTRSESDAPAAESSSKGFSAAEAAAAASLSELLLPAGAGMLSSGSLV